MASEVTSDTMSSLDSTVAPQPETRGKTWTELKSAVESTRRLVSSMAGGLPSAFKFHTLQTPEGPITRLYFLGNPPKSRESTLMYVDVPSTAATITPTLQWNTLLDAFTPSVTNSQMSREEQLLRERKRLGAFGITSYELTETGKFVFPACNSLFTCTDNTLTGDGPVLPETIETQITGARMDPKACPANTDLVAFIVLNDLYVANVRTGQELRLTHSNSGGTSLKDEPISSGVPSFVMQEEFDRYTGYWWEPGCHGDGETGNTYRILYEEVDESDVDILQVYSPMEDRGVDEYRYPRPGKCNARSCLRMVEFSLGANGHISERVVVRSLYESLHTLFPTLEYLVRVGWTPDAKYIHCQMLNRKQTAVTLVLIPVQCFVAPDPLADVQKMEVGSEADAGQPSVHVIYEDSSEIWVNVHDVLRFLPQTSSKEISFLWLSEKSGHRHLYHVTSDLTGHVTPSVTPSQSSGDTASRTGVHVCMCTNSVQLTAGEWDVQPKEIWVDTTRNLVFFIGLKDSVLETHLYVVSYISQGEVTRLTRLTELGYSHNIEFDKACSQFVDVYSSVNTTPMATLCQIFYTASGIKARPIGILMSAPPCPDYVPPELFNYKSKSGYTMHGMYYRPHNHQSGVRYPTVLFVYGGPHVQLVSNSFKGLKFLRLHTLASQGYAVVAIDCRGSSNRGIKFESHIKNRLGTTEIEDQVEGLQWLIAHTDFIDEDRVAIHGWSYGGYLSLMGLAQRPDVFKVSLAGAPVVDWALYDTGYTERYMDTPSNNTYGYRQGCVLNYINSFPNQENRLLIVHGLMDENVHFQHTCTLVGALVKACKPHQLQVYPNERHGIRNHDASEHYRTMVLNFLDKYL